MSLSSNDARDDREHFDIPRRLVRQRIIPEAANGLARGDLYALRRFIHGHAVDLEQRDQLAAAMPHLDLNHVPGLEAERLESNLRRFCGAGRVDVAESLLKLRAETVDNAPYLRGLNDPSSAIRRSAAELGDPNYLPGNTRNWKVFYTPRVEVWYTVAAEDAVLARHALTGQGATFNVEAGIRDYVLNRGTAQKIRLGRISNCLEHLNGDLEDVKNDHVPPARVQRIGLLAERAIKIFTEPPFGLRDPVPDGGRLRVRVCDVTDGGRRYPGATHPNWDHIRINGTFLSSELIGTVPHEVFHRIQYRYNDTAEDTGMQRALREGGARFAEDCFNDTPNRYLVEATPIFAEPWRSIASAGDAVEAPYDYEAGIFWKYLAEQHGIVTKEPARGIDLYRAVLECTATCDSTGGHLPPPADGREPSGYDVRLLRAAFAGMVWYGHFDRFLYLDEARNEVLSQETTWGNWLIANYLRGTVAAQQDGRFRYREDEAGQDDRSYRWTTELLRARVRSGDAQELSPGAPIEFGSDEREPPAWGGARYYRILLPPGPPCGLVEIALATDGLGADPLTQILLIDQDGGLRDLVRSDRPEMRRTVSSAGLGEIVVIVANRERPGRHRLVVRTVAPAPLVGATRWNCRAGTSYEVDPAGWSWTWLSPDMAVAGGAARAGVPQELMLRLRNTGNAAAQGVNVEFWYRPAGEAFGEAVWRRVQDDQGQDSTACVDLQPNAETWVTVPWLPVGPSIPPGWVIKARITALGDPNEEGKIVIGGILGVWTHEQAADPGSRARAAGLGRMEMRPMARRPGWRCDCASPLTAELDAPAALARVRRLAVSDGIVKAMPALGTSHKLTFLPCDDLPTWDGGRGDMPEPDRWYPPHPETLPPQLESEEAKGLATVVMVMDGMAISGATFLIPAMATAAVPPGAAEHCD